MIKVMIGNNVKRESALLDENTTLRSALEQYGIDYTRGLMHLDGAPLGPGDLDKTFSDFGITERCFLLNVVKADNAFLEMLVHLAPAFSLDLDQFFYR